MESYPIQNKKIQHVGEYTMCATPSQENGPNSLSLPPPLTSHNQRDRVLEGFACEPHYHHHLLEENRVHRVAFNYRHRFRVVRFPRFDGTVNEILSGVTKTQFEMVVFSSETGQWSKKLVSCPMGFTQCALLLPVVEHGGKLYLFWGKRVF